ncbi:hypothetical protein BDV27DRAFT_140805 [Aspergillus caelatus]|uniref:Uncharacterized protein n=1 Tax=Aspergillus caelatus TaxID=61420 RepID=A0A5N7ALL7_9EURO|nr:uncharacterized protein BDV27DRAFT_140805 [Aspergillus caelatus]KAE8369889.1 hypothetical protein BDV27DRAFT_140805 [Aspergillus caelatus]
MPCPAIDLEPYKAEITALYQRNEPVAAIQDYLKESFNLQLSKRTLESRLQEWGLLHQDRTVSINTDVQARIKVLFFQVGLEDKDILYVLHQEGVTLAPCTLRRMRKSLGLVRRTDSPFERQRQTEAILQALIEESEKGKIQGFGRGLLHQYIRTKGHIITRARLFQAYRTTFPDRVFARRHQLQRQRGEYIVPGPNFLWSVDGYMKLEPYGIEIYAGIDAYSRYIIWIYCGITTRTAISVLNQFLDIVETVQLQPQKIRSDHGSERGRFQDIYLQLQQAALYKSRTYFRTLKDKGLFSKSCTADQIALLSIYIPIIRTEIYGYVELWNVHQIRKQRNRPNSVAGKPYILYHHPKEGVRGYGLPIKQEVLDIQRQSVHRFDIDEYLPEETLRFCRTVLLGIGFDPERPPPLQPEDEAAPFRTIYLELREIISFHIDLFVEPFLGLLSRPTAGRRSNPEVD